MHYHIILTELCNSKCRYCYKKSMKEFGNDLEKKFKFDLNAPEKSIVKVKELKLKLNEIKDLINNNVVSKGDFEYEKYFGPEIIP